MTGSAHWDDWILSALILLLASVIAGVEAAVVSLPEARLRALHDELPPARARLLDRYLNDPSKVLTRLLALRVVGVVCSTALAIHAAEHAGAGFAGLGLVAFVLIGLYAFAAQFCISVGRSRGRDLAPLGLALSRPLEALVWPLGKPLEWMSERTHRVLGLRRPSEPPPVTGTEVEYVLEEAERSGGLDPRQGQIVQNVLDLRDVTARDVMVPRTRVVALAADTTLSRALEIVTDDNHSRVPVYRGQIDNLAGVLHVKDLFRVAQTAVRDGRTAELADRTVESLPMRAPVFVTAGQPALNVLKDLQSRRSHLAIVMDEFGGMLGIVTLEDVLEELVGDIQDEHDAEEALVVPLSADRWTASGQISLSHLADVLGVEFPEDGGYATLGGFLADLAGRVPPRGAVIPWDHLDFEVRDADGRSLRTVEIRVARKARPSSSAPTPGDRSNAPS